MKKQSILIGAIILALGGFVTKVLGAVYKIPLTHILGTTGIGIYYLVFPIFSLILIISSSGMSSAINILVAKERRQHNRVNEFRYFKASLIITFIISVFLSLITMMLSKDIAYMQGNVNAYISIIAVSPSIILASIISVVRGYFQGIENMIPTSISMILEQIVKMIVGLLFASISLPYGVEYAVLGAILGVTMSEIVALLIIVINFVIYKVKLDKNIIHYRETYILDNAKKHLKTRSKYKLSYGQKGVYRKNSISYKKAIKNLLKLSIPTTLIRLILPMITFIDSFVIINKLSNVGYTTATATSMYGISSGIVSSIIGMGMIVLSAITTTLIPKLNSDNKLDYSSNIRFYYKVNIYVGIIMFGIFIINAESIISILYGSTLNSIVYDEFGFSIKLMILSSISILYTSIMQSSILVLQSIGKSILPFILMGCSIIIRYILLGDLIDMGLSVFAVEIASTIYLGICSIICVAIIRRHIDFRLDGRFLSVGVGVSILIIILSMILKNLFKLLLPEIISSILASVVLMIVYLYIFIKGKIFTKKEKEMLLNFKQKKILKS